MSPIGARDLAAVELERLRSEVRRYKAAYQRALRWRATTDRLVEELRHAAERWPGFPRSSLRMPTRSRATRRKAVETPMLLLSDLHIGEVIRAEETHGLNAYNFDWFQARIERLEDRVVDILACHQRGPFSRLVVASLGDNVSGTIHAELEKYDAQPLVDQIYLGAMVVALFLWRLRSRLGVPVEVVALSGNHGRLTPERTFKRAPLNYDYLFHAIVALALRGVDGIAVRVPRSLFEVVSVGGQRILCSHGHELPPSPLGIPLYSINRASAGYQELLAAIKARRFDYWVLGHFHRPLELDGAIVNGTLAGLSEYAVGRFKPIRPMQRLVAFHPDYGKVWEYPIWLDRATLARSVYTFGVGETTDEALARLSAGLGGRHV